MGRFVFGVILVIIAIILMVAKAVMNARVNKLRMQLDTETDTYGKKDLRESIASAELVPQTLRIAVPVVLVLGMLLSVWSTVRVVPANNVGIPTNFGSIGSPLDAGFHFTAPWTSVHNFSTRVQELSMLKAIDEGDKAKDDSIVVIANGGGSMSIDLTVRFYVQKDKADTLFRQAGTMDLIRSTFVRPDAREVTRNVFGQFTAEEGYASKRAEISARIATELAPRLAGRGIILDSVNVRDVQPEIQVLNAINSILQSRNDALKAAEDQKKQVTESETRKQVAERDKTATITKAEADAESVRIKAEAQANANAKIAASLTSELVDLEKTKACADAISNSKATVINVCGNAQASPSGASSGSAVIVDGRK